MARTFEALKKLKGMERLPISVALTAFPSAGSEPAPKPDQESEVPFVEVGGPNKAVEGSAAVLACLVPARAKMDKPKIADMGEKVERMTVPFMDDSGPATLAFQPLAASLLQPKHRFGPELIAFHDSKHPRSQQYRAILSQLRAQWSPGKSTVVMFTTLASELTKTTVVLNLAITCARESECRVLIVEALTSRPRLAARLGLPDSRGLADVLRNTVNLTDAIQEIGLPNLRALASGEIGSGPANIDDKGMQRQVEKLRHEADVVLFDAPAWTGPELAPLAAACDALYLVLPESQADSAPAKELLQAIPRCGCPLAGSIHTHP